MTNRKPKIPPHIQAWQEETGHMNRAPNYIYEVPMQVDNCVYVDGKHVYSGPDCPHNTPDDLYPGWTVQSGS